MKGVFATIRAEGTKTFILDCSVTMAWFFYDEASVYADAVARRLPEVQALVPPIWHMEVGNAFLMAERRKRSTEADTANWSNALSAMAILAEEKNPDQPWNAILHVARAYGLSAYDASYLELALRRGLPLASLDDRLTSAATSAGVPLFQP